MAYLRVASCQFPVTEDIERNARFIRRYMKKAVNLGAHVLHTSEACLSGYAGVDFSSFDVFDWSVVRSTGTPEPGGFLWDEAVTLLQQIFMAKSIVGIDIVEFCGDTQDRNSAFAVAKLIYKMLGFKLAAEVDHGRMSWPAMPRGRLFE